MGKRGTIQPSNIVEPWLEISFELKELLCQVLILVLSVMDPNWTKYPDNLWHILTMNTIQ